MSSALPAYTPFLSGISTLTFEEKTQFFIKNISPDYMERAKKNSGDSLAILDGRATLPRVEGARSLRVTDDRKLMTLAGIYTEQVSKNKEAAFRAVFQTMGMQAAEGWGATAQEIRKESDEFNRSLKGFKLVESCSPWVREDCFIYIFKEAPWFSKYLSPGNTIQEVVQFFDEKGYKMTGKDKTPEIGQIVIYVRDGIPQHYGRVLRIEDGNPIIQSKFGSQDINEHPIELVPYEYGSEVIFLNQPPEKK